MAWLPSTVHLDLSPDPLFLGLPLLGREISILLTGASGVLAGQYFLLHGRTDPRILVFLAGLVCILTFAIAAVLVELSWVAQLTSAADLRLRFMWEYIVMQPMRCGVQALCQSYLIYRFYGLGKSCLRHRLVTFGFVLVLLAETALNLSLTILTVLAWTTMDAPTSAEKQLPVTPRRRYYERTIIDVYSATLFLATFLNSQLAIWFCWKLWTLRSHDEHTTKAIRFVVIIALVGGLLTAAMTLAWALWFAIEKSDAYRLLVDSGPPMYACELYLSLMSREKIRRSLQSAQVERNKKALARLSSDLLNSHGDHPTTTLDLPTDMMLGGDDMQIRSAASVESTMVGHGCLDLEAGEAEKSPHAEECGPLAHESQSEGRVVMSTTEHGTRPLSPWERSSRPRRTSILRSLSPVGASAAIPTVTAMSPTFSPASMVLVHTSIQQVVE